MEFNTFKNPILGEEATSALAGFNGPLSWLN